MTWLAWAGVRAHPVRLLSTALSVVLSIAFVTGTFMFTDTVRSAFDQLFGSAAAGVDVVVRAVPAFEAGAQTRNRPKVPEQLVDQVEAVDGVAAAEPRFSGLAELVDADGEVLGSQGPPKVGTDRPNVEQLATYELRSGRYPDTGGEIAIDVASAAALGVGVGDQAGVVLNGPVREFTVVGTVGLPGAADDLGGTTVSVFDDATARELYGTGGAVSIAVAAERGVQATVLQRAVAEALGPDYEALTGDEVASESAAQVGEFLGFLTTGLLVFAGVALLVGAIIILNTFSITVAQRTRELALLQAVGADRRQVLVTVLLEALTVGVLGSMLGLVVGVGVAQGLRALLSRVGVPLPSTGLTFSPRTAVIGIALGSLVTLLAAAGPAIAASRVAPVEALRAVATGRSPRIRPVRAIVGALLAAAGAVALWRVVTVGGSQARWLLGGGAVAVLCAVALLSPLVMAPVARLLGAPIAAARGLPGALARENATRNPRRTAATASALVIGLGLVCFVLIFIASLRGSVDAVLEQRFVADYQVQAADVGGFPVAATAAVRAVPGVAAISPVKFGYVGLEGQAREILGVDVATLPQTFALDVVAGKLADVEGGAGVALADDLAADLGLRLGDPVELAFLPETPPERFTVVATFDPVALPGGQGVGRILVDVDRYAEAVPFALDAAAFVRVADGADPEAVRAGLEQALAPFPGARLVDATGIRDQVADQTNQLLGLVIGLLLLSVIIALTGVVNILGLSVLERTRELGLLQAVGMTRGQARQMVRWESVIIALLGAVVGLAAGTALGWLGVRALADEGLEVFRVPFSQMAAAVLVAALAGVAASVLPARRAAAVDPLRALSVE